NLLKNAQQAVPEKRHGKMIISLSESAQEVTVSFHDNGTGIPEDVQPRVFTPNFTTKTSGMGLGLAITKQIIENAGGEIWFETEIGVGTTFFVRFKILNVTN